MDSQVSVLLVIICSGLPLRGSVSSCPSPAQRLPPSLPPSLPPFLIFVAVSFRIALTWKQLAYKLTRETPYKLWPVHQLKPYSEIIRNELLSQGTTWTNFRNTVWRRKNPETMEDESLDSKYTKSESSDFQPFPLRGARKLVTKILRPTKKCIFC